MANQYALNIFRSLLTLLLTGMVAGAVAAEPSGTQAYPPNGSPESAHVQIGTMDSHNELNKLVRGIMQEAYVAIGRVPHYILSPPRRSLMLAGNGLLDAELFRVSAIEKLYPDLVRVDFPLYRVEGIAYAKKGHLPIYSCKDLSNYRVGVERGIVIMEECAAGAQQLVHAPDLASLAHMLAMSRVDVVLVERVNGQMQIEPNVPGVTALPTPLFSTPLYHYVHKSAGYLVQPLTAALRDMESRGALAAHHMFWRIRLATQPAPVPRSSNKNSLGHANPAPAPTD